MILKAIVKTIVPLENVIDDDLTLQLKKLVSGLPQLENEWHFLTRHKLSQVKTTILYNVK